MICVYKVTFTVPSLVCVCVGICECRVCVIKEGGLGERYLCQATAFREVTCSRLAPLHPTIAHYSIPRDL